MIEPGTNTVFYQSTYAHQRLERTSKPFRKQTHEKNKMHTLADIGTTRWSIWTTWPKPPRIASIWFTQSSIFSSSRGPADAMVAPGRVKDCGSAGAFFKAKKSSSSDRNMAWWTWVFGSVWGICVFLISFLVFAWMANQTFLDEFWYNYIHTGPLKQMWSIV